jgi:glycosyltransferase involved in cell wall biosynthesis
LAVPTIVHVRGPLAPRDIRKHCLDRVDALIPIARRYADDLAAAGVDPARITIIDDAVDLRLFSRERAASGFLSRRFGVGEELKVGIVGRITPFKQIDAFVKAVAALPPALYARARFLVVGAWAEPEYRQTIESYVSRLGLGSKVTFLGRIEDEIPSLLADLDLLVTFSGGSVMFEAMAMGTPVLSVRSDARHSEHTRHGETAWCVVTDAVADASQALAHLLRDGDLRHRLGEAGSAYVRDHLSVSAMVTKTEALYERLLRAGS